MKDAPTDLRIELISKLLKEQYPHTPISASTVIRLAVRVLAEYLEARLEYGEGEAAHYRILHWVASANMGTPVEPIALTFCGGKLTCPEMEAKERAEHEAEMQR